MMMFITEIDTIPNLSSQTVNDIENLAIYIAAQNDGQLYTSQLMPYFTLSIKQLDNCLKDMVDNSSILSLEQQGINYYKLKNLSAEELPEISKKVREISQEADTQKIKIEHQIFFAASHVEGKIHPASIAANTDFTLQEVKKVMDELNLEGFITEKLDEENGSIYYIFPKMEYPERNYKTMMTALLPKGSQESFDAKMAVFIKYMFICLILLVMLFFAKVNFRFLAILFLLSMPVSAFLTYVKCKSIKG